MRTDPRDNAGAAVWKGSEKAVAVAAGGQHNLLLTESGKVLASGNNERGQTDVPKSLARVTAVAAGFAHSLALTETGTVVAWGNNARGATSVPSTLTDVVAISGGGGHSMALTRDGQVTVWGELGYGSASPPEGLRDVIAIASGWENCFAVRRDGTVAAWGETQFGPATVPDGLSDVAAIAALAGPAPLWVAAKRDGGMTTGGGWLRDVAHPPLDGVVQLAAGEMHVLALREDGTVVGWGNSPVRHAVPEGLAEVTFVAAGNDHSLALRSDGTVVAWGKNSRRQLEPPRDFEIDMVGWQGDGYYLAALGGEPAQGIDPYSDDYGRRVDALHSPPTRPGGSTSADDVDRLWGRAVDAEERGDLGLAVRLYEKVIAESPSLSTPRTLATLSLAPILKRRGQNDRAIRWLTALAEDGDPMGMDSLAAALAESERYEESISWYSKALEHWDSGSLDFGDVHETLRAAVMANIGRSHHLLGDGESAITWYEKALDTGHLDTDGRSDVAGKLGVALKDRGRTAEAINWLRVAAETGEPGRMAILGTSLMDAGNTPEGIEWLRRAASSGDVRTMRFLGMTLVGQGGAGRSEGYGWLRSAASAGDQEAIRLVGTADRNHARPPQPESPRSGQTSGGCYIATAVYGSYDAHPVRVLREFRDRKLSRTRVGRDFIRAYYRFSPAVARWMQGRVVINQVIKAALDWVVIALSMSQGVPGNLMRSARREENALRSGSTDTPPSPGCMRANPGEPLPPEPGQQDI